MVLLVEGASSVLGNFRVAGVAFGLVGDCAASGVICAVRAMAAKESAEASAEGTRRLKNSILVTLRRFRESQGWV